jgi:predicted transcriptional regulator
MREWILKIEKWAIEEMLDGKKKFEYRKTNKYYINKDDIIAFSDLNNKEIYCRFKVDAIEFIRKDEELEKEHLKDSRTFDFIYQNYIDENVIMKITIGKLKSDY